MVWGVNSEDAKSYKSRKKLFQLALTGISLKPEQVVHISDSLSSDVKRAKALGIKALWVNRSEKEISEGIESISNLLEISNKMEVYIRRSD